MKARTQLTVAATAVVALLVALTGQFIVWRTDHRDRADVDRALATRAAQIRTDATKTGKLPTDGVYAVRLMSGTQVRAQSGSAVQFSSPVRDGFSTVVAADGRDYRSWAETLKTGVQLQVLTSLSDVQGRHTEAVRLVDLSVLVAILLGGLATWLVSGVVLRPLRRLEEGARELSPDDLGGRLPGVTEPREVAEIASSVNALLDRMQAVAESAAGRPAPGTPTYPPFAPPTTSTVTPPPAVPDTFPPRPAVRALPAAPAPARGAPANSSGAPTSAVAKSGNAKPAGPTPVAPPPIAPTPANPLPANPLPAGPTRTAAVADRDDEALRDALTKLGDDLDTLLDNPELTSTQRHLILASIQNEYRRIVVLTEAGDTA
jgi:HAMP domain-containing protein